MKKRIATWSLGTLLALLLSTNAWAEVKRVYLLASYEQDHVCGWPQEQGVIKGLNKAGWFEGMNLEVKRFYMDTKRTNTTREAMQRVAAEALAEIEAFKPDVLVTLDDNAFREAGLKMAGKPGIATVFSGLNGQPEAYNEKVPFMQTRQAPGSNITGVYEKLYVTRSIKVLESAVAGVRGGKVVGITDFSPTGNAISRQFELELAEHGNDINWELERVKDWADYTALIKRLNDDPEVKAIYPVALTLKVSETETYTAPEIFKWTIANSTKPEMALNYFFSKVGLFGGAAVDFKAMGHAAGRQAGEVLNGAPAGSMPIVDAPEYAIVFNLKRAKQLAVDIPAPLLTAADFIYRD